MKPEKYIKNYINGAMVEPISGTYIDVQNPATAQVYAYAPDSNVKDTEEAIAAALAAYPKWAKTTPKMRSRLMYRLADIIEQYIPELARAETIDTGKPLNTTQKVDIPGAQSNVRFYASALLSFHTDAYAHPQSGFGYTTRQPIGVVGCIVPWHMPLYALTWKVAPAIAAGNCVVVKPSELTPMTAFLFAKACQEAGIPPGVVNIVHGYGPTVGHAIVEHPAVRAISFTGGVSTGRKIATAAAQQFKKLSMELGGKNVGIIAADADLDTTMSALLSACFSHQGQMGVSLSRLLIHASIYETFKVAFMDKVRMMRVGDPLQPITNLGPLITDLHREKVLNYIELAKQEGGVLLTGGEPAEGNQREGYFLKPTLIEGLPMSSRINQEDIFGPVVTLTPYVDDAEAIALANQSNYGLVAGIWTQSLDRAHRLAAALEVGNVWLNHWMVRDLRTPFGGIKASGWGTEGGLEALRFYTEQKYIQLRYPPA